MFSLFRMMIFLAIVVLFIPADEQELTKNADIRSVGPVEAIVVAKAAVDDARGFCARNPTACETGASLAAVFSAKARTGVRYMSDWLATPKTETPERTARDSSPIVTGSLPAPVRSPVSAPAQSFPHAAEPTAGTRAAILYPEPPRKPSRGRAA